MTSGSEVVFTRDGVRAMLDRGTGELMHPVGGPRVEAERLYLAPSKLEARLRAGPASEALTLLDIGLGAGSNAGAALRLSEALPGSARPLHVLSFERNFEALELALDDAHSADFGLSGAVHAAARTLLAEGSASIGHSRWHLERGDLRDTLLRAPAACADVVFWDPFSPRADSTMWSMSIFTALRRLCRDGATVHTYSGATSVRTALLLAGFAVGIGEEVNRGKFSTAAAVRVHDLARPLPRAFLERVARSTAPFPTDAPANALQALHALPVWDEEADLARVAP